MVGDVGDDLHTIPNLNQVRSPGRTGSNLQLLSDAKGVDFQAVSDSGADRGPAQLDGVISRKRTIRPARPRADPVHHRSPWSRSQAGDRRRLRAPTPSIAPPSRGSARPIRSRRCPAEYKGDQIRLQLAFSYNMPSRVSLKRFVKHLMDPPVYSCDVRLRRARDPGRLHAHRSDSNRDVDNF